MCLKFAKNCAKNELTKDLFPLNQPGLLNTRSQEMYRVQHANNNRLKDSATLYAKCQNYIRAFIIKPHLQSHFDKNNYGHKIKIWYFEKFSL